MFGFPYKHVWVGFLYACSLLAGSSEKVGELPVGSEPPAVEFPHFPDPLHALVWRNWFVVAPDRIASVVGTDATKIREMAVSMGLPEEPVVSEGMDRRGFITVVRRNWHLLPYEQLLTLLDMTAEELKFLLREDDFLYHKLGRLKPKCAPIRYQPPSQEKQEQVAQIRAWVQHYFGDTWKMPAEPRFSFVDTLSMIDPKNAQRQYDPEQVWEGLRFLYSYFGLYGDPLSDPTSNPYPEGLLAKLAASGVNGVWLHTVLRKLAPGGPDFPEFGDGHEQRLENLRNLVARAKRYGIGVYLYINEPRARPVEFFANRPEMAGVAEEGHRAMCTCSPQVRRWITESLAYVFHEVPDLAGVFTITGSENLTSCASHGKHAECPRCSDRSEAEIVAEVNTSIEEGVHRSSPRARVIVWDWGWYGHGDATETIARLPKSVWLMSVSEWAKPFERGGLKQSVGEYSISVVGPGPRAKRHWALAKQAGLQTVAKMQLNTSWELGSLPFLPILDLVAQHCANLSETDMDGIMLSWTLGCYPSPNLQVAHHFFQEEHPTVKGTLDAIAVQRYGAQAAPDMRKAWTAYSRAFTQFPFHIDVVYMAPVQIGPANLLYNEPTGYQASMCGIPYDDVDGWRGPYEAKVFAELFSKMADDWKTGIRHHRRALEQVPVDKRAVTEGDLRVARAAGLYFDSVANQTRFVLARDALQNQDLSEVERESYRHEIVDLLDAEIQLAQQMFALAKRDSRLGFEASNHYFYLPHDLVEKVLNCAQIRQEYAAEEKGALESPEATRSS